MEIELDPDLAEALAAEADERGFDGTEAYARWLLEHREGVVQPPGERLQARLDRVEDELQRLRRTLEDGFETEITVESGTDVTDGPSGGVWFDERTSEDSDAGDAIDDVGREEQLDEGEENGDVSEFAYSDDLEPPADVDEHVEEELEDAADDDEIAEALANVELEDEEDENEDSDGAERENDDNERGADGDSENR